MRMTSQPIPRSDRPTKVIVLAGEFLWSGVAYTTRCGSRQVFGSTLELLRTIAELIGWPGAETALPARGSEE
jgi:hypothetical protein